MNADSTSNRNGADEALRQRIGQSIQRLRQIQHLSQAELARRIGVRPGPLNTIEKGRHVPSGRLLIKLADELGVSVDDLLGRTKNSSVLCENRSEYLVDESASFRPYAQPVTLRDDQPLDPAVELRLDKMARTFLELEDVCGAQKFATIPLQASFNRDDKGIEWLAYQVRHFLGIGQGVIFDYVELFENAGLRVVFCALPDTQHSVAYYDAVNANAFFFINEKQSAERQLFELAKRLGAIYLRTGRDRPMGDPSLPPLDTLRLARKFAAFFLMPESAMRTTVAQTGITPDRWTYELILRLKHRFGVSAESFVIRLEELALIKESLAATFKARIRKDYKKTGHKEPDGTRRVLTPNGRLGDLMAVAGRQER